MSLEKLRCRDVKVFFLLFSIVTSLFLILTNTVSVNGIFTGDIHGNTYINQDGTIEPSTAPIQRIGEVYTITDDFDGYHLRVERSNIVVDGNGFTIFQNILLHHVSNVTIKNFLITNPGAAGICLDYSSNSIITNNIIWNCGVLSGSSEPMSAAIFVNEGDSNLVLGNTIENNVIGMIVKGSPNTLIYDNNFIENQIDVSEFDNYGIGDTIPSIALFDNGQRGNYWDRFSGNDENKDGIGDEPYIIDENNQDNYPLMTSNDVPEFPSWMLLSLFLVTSAVVLVARNYLRKNY